MIGLSTSSSPNRQTWDLRDNALKLGDFNDNNDEFGMYGLYTISYSIVQENGWKRFLNFF